MNPVKATSIFALFYIHSKTLVWCQLLNS